MSAPLIGLTTRNTVSPTYNIPLISSPRSYVEALSRAGAAALLLPLGLKKDQLERLVNMLDGIIFTGGGDIETARFQGTDHPLVSLVDPERDEMEFDLVCKVREAEIPLFGICRGIQVINVAFGGSLYTHLADQAPETVEHTFFPGYPWDHIAHAVQVAQGSLLAEIVEEPSIQVNSLHHQGIRALASNLTAVGWSPDGLVEAVELTDYPFGLAVQWHPEWLPEAPHSQALFEAFVAAASHRRRKI